MSDKHPDKFSKSWEIPRKSDSPTSNPMSGKEKGEWYIKAAAYQRDLQQKAKTGEPSLGPSSSKRQRMKASDFFDDYPPPPSTSSNPVGGASSSNTTLEHHLKEQRKIYDNIQNLIKTTTHD